MELELKHLACYLPYGLKVFHNHNIYEVTIEDRMDSETISFQDAIENLHKPILRPLTDLTKEITIDGYNEGKPFMPIERVYYKTLLKEPIKFIINEYEESIFIQWEFADNRSDYDVIHTKNIMNSISASFYEILLSWHFDFHKLIEKGLAIDINTLK